MTKLKPRATYFPLFAGRLLTQIAIEEGHDLRAGAAVGWADGRGAVAGYDALGNRPQNCVCIVSIAAHVAKRVGRSHHALAPCAPQEGDGLGAFQSIVG